MSNSRRNSTSLIRLTLLLVALTGWVFEPGDLLAWSAWLGGPSSKVVQAAAPNGSLVMNGDFETGDFTGWTVNNPCGNPSGNWFVYSGSTTPLTAQPISPPPQGVFAAVTDQEGPGTHILHQEVALEPEQAYTLSFVVYYDNLAADGFFTPPSLNCDFAEVGGNQQYRVDIMNPDGSSQSQKVTFSPTSSKQTWGTRRRSPRPSSNSI